MVTQQMVTQQILSAHPAPAAHVEAHIDACRRHKQACDRHLDAPPQANS